MLMQMLPRIMETPDPAATLDGCARQRCDDTGARSAASTFATAAGAELTPARLAGAIKRDIHALYLAGRDPRVPWMAKAVAAATAAYALSPIDLIPDFIPILGQLRRPDHRAARHSCWRSA